jgi:hypothetical protein
VQPAASGYYFGLWTTVFFKNRLSYKKLVLINFQIPILVLNLIATLNFVLLDSYNCFADRKSRYGIFMRPSHGGRPHSQHQEVWHTQAVAWVWYGIPVVALDPFSVAEVSQNSSEFNPFNTANLQLCGNKHFCLYHSSTFWCVLLASSVETFVILCSVLCLSSCIMFGVVNLSYWYEKCLFCIIYLWNMAQ